MKRFYRKAAPSPRPGSGHPRYIVSLDDRPLKTPMKADLFLSSLPLAEAIADEWNAQGETIVPAQMPLTQLASTMTDKVLSFPDRAAMTTEVCRYGESDLLCYFATHPPELVRRQESLWLPYIQSLKDKHGIGLSVVSGIRFLAQPAADMARLRARIEAMSPEAFTVVQAATGATGSVVLALALAEGAKAEDVFAAATVDEQYQLERWGEDPVARDRLRRIEKDIEICALFLRLSLLPAE